MRAALRFCVGAGLALSMSLSAWAAPNWKTLTDAPRDLGGARSNPDMPNNYVMSDDMVIVTIPGDEWTINHLGQMGADMELLSDRLMTRLGVWAGQSLKGKNPRATVSEWITNISGLTGGTWTAPKQQFFAGVPVTYATGVDVFGNYHYGLYAWTRYGVNYGLALRTPYENRWNTELDRHVSYIISESHMSTKALRKLGYK